MIGIKVVLGFATNSVAQGLSMSKRLVYVTSRDEMMWVVSVSRYIVESIHGGLKGVYEGLVDWTGLAIRGNGGRRNLRVQIR